MARLRIHYAIEVRTRIDATTVDLATRHACSRSHKPSRLAVAFDPAKVNCGACKQTEAFRDARRITVDDVRQAFASVPPC